MQQQQQPLPPPSSIDALLHLQQLNVSDPSDPSNLRVSLAAASEASAPGEADADTEAYNRQLETLTDLSRQLLGSKLVVPPFPVKPQPNQRSTLVARSREEGNTAFKSGNYAEAHTKYSISIAIASTRPTFEPAVYARDELSVALCNRAAASLALFKAKSDHPAANLDLAQQDAEATIKVKKVWPKGHFRLGKVLQEQGQLVKAKESFLLGLEFDPDSKVCVS